MPVAVERALEVLLVEGASSVVVLQVDASDALVEGIERAGRGVRCRSEHGGTIYEYQRSSCAIGPASAGTDVRGCGAAVYLYICYTPGAASNPAQSGERRPAYPK